LCPAASPLFPEQSSAVCDFMAQPAFHIPDELARRATDLHGPAGVEWLERLPALVSACAERWSLTPGPPFDDVGYSYVAPCVRDTGEQVALKIAFPNRELTTEIAALRLFDGRGAVRLLESDEESGAMLLERPQPGRPLTDIADDEQATAIAAAVMRRLWRPAPEEHPFPTVEEWNEGFGKLRRQFDGATGPLPPAMVEEAERLSAELIGSATEHALLHGDLHHGNILSARREPWLAIDPKGVVGEPAYETAPLLLNPFSRVLRAPQPARVMSRRLDVLSAELGFDRERLRCWGLARAVLSAWWSIEDHGSGWESAIAHAEVLASTGS